MPQILAEEPYGDALRHSQLTAHKFVTFDASMHLYCSPLESNCGVG
jgi:hypothetical protein